MVKHAIRMFLNIPHLGVLTDTFTATRSHWKQFPYQWRISLSPNIDIMLNRSIQERSNYGKRPVLSVSGSPWEAAGQDRSRPNWWSGMIIIFHSLKASLCNVTFQLKICHLKMISYHIWFFKMMLKGGQNDVLSVMLKFNFTLEKNVPSYGF